MSRVQRVDHGQDFFVGWDIAGVVSVVCVLDDAIAINNENGGHPPKFAQLELLAELGQETFVRIRDTFERETFLVPVFRHSLRLCRGDCNDLDIAGGKFRVVLAQLRQLFLADRSPESAEKRQDYMLLAAVVGE